MVKKKILKIITIIAVLFFIILLVHTIKNYMIINGISKKQEEISKFSNYYFAIEKIDNNGEKIIIQNYNTEDKCMKVIFKNNENLIIHWYDKDKKDLISMYPKDAKAIIEKKQEYEILQIPITFLENNKVKQIANNLLYSMTSFISYDKIDNDRCYVISNFGAKYYYSMENGTLLANSNGFAYKDYSFNKLTEEEVSKPNLVGYDIEE